MKAKNLVILFVTAGALVALAMLTSRDRAAQSRRSLGGKLFPNLDINAVEKIVINGGSQTSQVARTEAGWVVPARFSHPARFEKVREVLLSLSELKTGPAVRVSEEQKKTMNISPPQAGGGGGKLVSLLGRDGKPVAAMIMGIVHESRPPDGDPSGRGYPDGRYVSPDGGQTVYLVPAVLNDMPADLLSLSGQDIRDIRITRDGGAPVHLQRSTPSEKMAIADIPDGKELDLSKMYAVESALSFLRCNDVADPALDDSSLGMTTATVFRAETFKGEVYTVRVGGTPTGAEERYARVGVELLPREDAPAGTNDVADAAARDRERKELEDKVSSLRKRLAGWTYMIPSYSADSMCKSPGDLLKDKEAPAAAAGDEDGKPAAGAGPASGDAAPAPAAEEPAGVTPTEQ
jgi:hypothetical protein